MLIYLLFSNWEQTHISPWKSKRNCCFSRWWHYKSMTKNTSMNPIENYVWLDFWNIVQWNFSRNLKFSVQPSLASCTILISVCTNTVLCHYNAVNFCNKYSQKTSHSSPVKTRYGVSVKHPASDKQSTSVPVTIHVIIPYNIGPC